MDLWVPENKRLGNAYCHGHLACGADRRFAAEIIYRTDGHYLMGRISITAQIIAKETILCKEYAFNRHLWAEPCQLHDSNDIHTPQTLIRIDSVHIIATSWRIKLFILDAARP